MTSKNKVKVFVRFRPTPNFAQDQIEFHQDGKTINIHAEKNERHRVVNNQLLDWSFKVDGILHNASQEQVHDTVVSDMTNKAMQGYNGTLLAYGQTGAGKTYTITGTTENYKHRGVIPRAIAEVFRSVEADNDRAISIKISYLEIYNENMFDLLSTLPESHDADNNLTIVEETDGSVRVKGLSLHTARDEGEALNLLFEGETNRAISSHTLNKNSTRSHCIFTIHIEARSNSESNAKYVVSKLNLVDLAGSERIGKTGSEGQTQTEAMYINKSLTFLEQTVIALADKRRSHVPFRQTKLTHALKDSIGGKCCTTMIANVYGEAAQLDETISTLRFALRMMCVPVEAAVNEHYDPWLLVGELEKEISHLKEELAMHDALANRSHVSYDPLSDGQIEAIKRQVRSFLDGKIEEIDVSNLRQISTIFLQFREVVGQMEKDITADIQSKFVLFNRSDTDLMNALQKSGIPTDPSDTLAASAEAATTAIVPPINLQGGKEAKQKIASSNRRKSGKKSRAGAASPLSRMPPTPVSPTTTEAKPTKSSVQAPNPALTDGGESVKKEGSQAGSTEAATVAEVKKEPASRPSTPPPRETMFEEFKKEKGQEINRILNENKTILVSKKRMVRDLGHAVNATKRMIDDTRLSLDAKQKDRMEQGEFVNAEGETVIDEEEFELIKKLKSLKLQYRTDFDKLRSTKSEVEYCQKLVDACRQKLIQEFDNWYNESFTINTTETSASVGYGGRPGLKVPARLQIDTDQGFEAEQESFEQSKEEFLLTQQESAAFYNAKMRTMRRQTYDRATSKSHFPPGTPQISIKNKPPNQFSLVF